MHYGMVSALDDETTKYVFRGKKITENQMIPNYQIGEVVNHLHKGDVVYAISVNRFNSVSHLLAIGRLCRQKGVSLRFIGQPYLDLADGKCWRDAVLWQMEKMKSIEITAKGRLQQCMRMNNEGWAAVFRCIEIMNLEILAHTFSTDGILKRGGN